jgi:hypothetical protein
MQMAALWKTLALSLVALAVAPVAALAKPQAQPLVDAAPLGTQFKDRVTSGSARVAHAAQSGSWQSYPTKEGTSVSAAISAGYANTLSAQVAQSYVDFLDSLDHGPELSQLKIYIAPPSEVVSDCGGVDGTLACYDSSTKIMTVPGQQVDSGTSGVTTSYVVAHEYGHHIAAARDNAPFSAFEFGPKYWASYELVCDRSVRGLLAPGNESDRYGSNPGEGWAETYAHLKYPDVGWTFNPLMAPDQGAYAAAAKDVLNPWMQGVTKVFKSRFGARGSNAKRFSFLLTLDGSLQIKLYGPRKANYNLSVASNGHHEGSTKKAGSRDSLSYAAACRQVQTEHVTVAVKRVTGTGPFTLRVKYAG